MPGEIGFVHAANQENPGGVVLTCSDGFWCEISQHTSNGTRQVWETGHTRLWRAVEDAYQLWQGLGEPGWDRFGLTVTAEQQWIWLDSPDSAHCWSLPP